MAKPWKDHPLAMMTPGMWNAEAAAVVPSYPKTKEAFERQMGAARNNRAKAQREGKLNRRGVPNGWAGTKRRRELGEHYRDARETAGKIMVRLNREKVFEPDCWEARIAMEALVAMVVNPATPPRQKVVAATTVLEFTVGKLKRGTTQEEARKMIEGLQWLAGLDSASNEERRFL